MKTFFKRFSESILNFAMASFLLYLVIYMGDEVSAIRQDFNSFYYDDLSGSEFSKAMPDAALDKLSAVQSNLDILGNHFSFLVLLNYALIGLAVILLMLRLRK